MGYKSLKKHPTFSDLEFSDTVAKNRTIAILDKLGNMISWDRVESSLMQHYTVGQKKEGNLAYPPLLLFKCMLLQNWFAINSDPELQSQINDRLSFKKFLGLSLNENSPNYSTFSRFRTRLTKTVFNTIIGEVLEQFSKQGITVQPGSALDPRIVKVSSGSEPVIKDKP